MVDLLPVGARVVVISEFGRGIHGTIVTVQAPHLLPFDYEVRLDRSPMRGPIGSTGTVRFTYCFNADEVSPIGGPW